MAKKPRTTRLVRDNTSEQIPLGSFKRLERGGKRHKQELRRRLRQTVDRLHETDYVDHEAYADVVEVMKCLAFCYNVDWLDVEDAVWHEMITKGKYIDGILQTKGVEDE